MTHYRVQSPATYLHLCFSELDGNVSVDIVLVVGEAAPANVSSVATLIVVESLEAVNSTIELGGMNVSVGQDIIVTVTDDNGTETSGKIRKLHHPLRPGRV